VSGSSVRKETGWKSDCAMDRRDPPRIARRMCHKPGRECKV
jgi:hypothetical protein